jgi:hypothetical protein
MRNLNVIMRQNCILEFELGVFFGKIDGFSIAARKSEFEGLTSDGSSAGSK